MALQLQAPRIFSEAEVILRIIELCAPVLKLGLVSFIDEVIPTTIGVNA